MRDDSRPSPDALLRALQKAEAADKKGKLSIFFGMAAGSGKTYAMLEAAQNRLKDGVDVIIGVVETHGRTETEALLRGLPSIPKRKIHYRGAELDEFDIDAVLLRHPSLILVDELAHTNAPGSRHAKRWQDVLELLDAGIDVYTTLNVQHIESRKESVEAVTGVTIRETVPDSILERAAQIELVDITPADLLKRLNEGKVYTGDMATQAAENFFKEDRLSALREIALRLTAEKVENDLQTLLTLRGMASGWKSTERLMVAVSHSPYSEGLIRATRRLAYALEAPWIAVYVDTGANLSADDKSQLSKNLGLVKELGGETVLTAGPDIADTLRRIAEQRNVTQVIFGRPVRRWFRDLMGGGTPLDRLVSESGRFDVLILRQDKFGEGPRRRFSWPAPESGFLSYWYILWLIGAVSLLNYFLDPIIGYRATGFIFLLSILIISLFVSLGPILFAAILSSFIWDFFFIPPVGTFAIRAPEDAFMGFVYFVVAVVTGTLTHRIRKRENLLRQREERTTTLYEIVKAIAATGNMESFIDVTTNQLSSALNGKCGVYLSDSQGALTQVKTTNSLGGLTDHEMAVAKYVFEKMKPGGWSTDTLPSADSLYLPLVGTADIVGVLVFNPKSKTKLLPEEMEFLLMVTRQLAIGVEREILNEKSRQAHQLQESERLHQTILDSISHEIRTPLTTIIGASSALQDREIADNIETRDELTEEIIDASGRLNLVVENLLDTSRLGSGMLKLKLEWCDPKDLLSVTLEILKKLLESYGIKVSSAEELPLIYVDFHLMEQVLSNLIRNAAIATPAGKEITIDVKAVGESLEITILDSGPGIPEDAMKDVFKRFYRVVGTPAGGMGLGLWLAKNIVELHGGKISVQNRSTGGAAFTVSLPLKPQPEIPSEEEHGTIR
ncbi:MAG TPA: two-component sensor histidine kinase [candidate division Zixibacteria bacterium]|nr:two-component sensor histidine kinase [candidate division Zixibacteria bacterium]